MFKFFSKKSLRLGLFFLKQAIFVLISTELFRYLLFSTASSFDILPVIPVYAKEILNAKVYILVHNTKQWQT